MRSSLFVHYSCIIVTFYIRCHNSSFFAEHELEYVILDWINMLVNHHLTDKKTHTFIFKKKLTLLYNSTFFYSIWFGVLSLFFSFMCYNGVEMKEDSVLKRNN